LDRKERSEGMKKLLSELRPIKAQRGREKRGGRLEHPQEQNEGSSPQFFMAFEGRRESRTEKTVLTKRLGRERKDLLGRANRKKTAVLPRRKNALPGGEESDSIITQRSKRGRRSQKRGNKEGKKFSGSGQVENQSKGEEGKDRKKLLKNRGSSLKGEG